MQGPQGEGAEVKQSIHRLRPAQYVGLIFQEQANNIQGAADVVVRSTE